MRRIVAWPLVAAAVGLALTSWVLALQAIVTLPTALCAGVAATLGFFPPRGGLTRRHYVLFVALSAVCVVVTILWQSSRT